MFWKSDPIWGDQTVFVVGGGSSLSTFDFERLRDRHVLVINEAYKEVPWASILFFRDQEWFEKTRPDLHFKNYIITTHRAFIYYKNVFLINNIPKARTSGHCAVSLCMKMNAKRVVLLGFDHDIEGSHYHNRYGDYGIRYDYLPDTWKNYKTRADERDISIINATPDSRIDAFPKVSLEDVL